MLNPAALTPLNGETADKCSFKVGDFVRISDDLERVKTLQRGHGEWVDSMLPVNLDAISFNSWHYLLQLIFLYRHILSQISTCRYNMF